MGRTVLSDDEEDEVEEVEEDQPSSRRGRDDDDEDDEEDEEDGQDEFEKDGFIVDDEDEEEEGEEEEERSDDDRRKKKRKKRRESEDFTLDEDDYMLLQDNNITGISRPKPGNKFKRLKKAGKESEMDEHGLSDDDGTGKRRTGKERVEYSLFGDAQDAAPFEEDIIEDEQQVDDNEVDDEDEMADFIVDEEEIDGNGQVVRKKVKKKVPRQAAGVSSSALQEAQDIFGDVDDLLARRKQELEREAINSGELRGKRLEDEFEP
ncbi:unnamed protein product, partial [Urochloa humidicola]